MMNILFYTPFNSRSRDTESLMQAFVRQGHKVFLLTQTERGVYHEYCENLGVSTFYYSIEKGNALVYFLRHAFYLCRFSATHEINVLYAHLETASLPAVLIQNFIKAKVFACRHVIDEAYLFKNRNFILLNKIVYRLAKNIIVVSEHCKVFMIAREKVKASKIQVINLAYNFDLYSKIDHAKANEIRKSYPCRLLLLTACRMVGPKRPDYSIQIAKRLKEKGLDCKLLLLGDGPDQEMLQSKIKDLGIADAVFFLGFKPNMLDYISACDILVHPSLLDSSSVIIKESGLCGRTVIACTGIGDVDEYLVNQENAFLVSKENCIDEMTVRLSEVYNEKEALGRMGLNLKESVLKRFSIESVLGQYESIHKVQSGL